MGTTMLDKTCTVYLLVPAGFCHTLQYLGWKLQECSQDTGNAGRPTAHLYLHRLTFRSFNIGSCWWRFSYLLWALCGDGVFLLLSTILLNLRKGTFRVVMVNKYI